MSGMANETTLQTSHNQESHDEYRENVPPGVTAATGNSNLKVQVGDVVGYSSTQPTGENEPLSDTCTFSTPALTNSNGQSKTKSRLSGLQSALTPILKYLNIANKCPSPEPLKRGNSPHSAVSFLCKKSTRSSSQHPNSDSSSSYLGQSLGGANAPVGCLYDEYLPEITLLDVSCDSTMQMTKNESALPDSVPATPTTAGSVKSTFIPLKSSQLSASTNLDTTAQGPCPQNKTLDLPPDPLQSNVDSPKVKCDATDQASSVSKNTTEISHVINVSSLAGKASGSCDVQDISFDSHSLQKSSGRTIFWEAQSTACFKNGTINTKSPSKQNGTVTVSETSSHNSHQSITDKSCLQICNVENHSHALPSELSKHKWTTATKDAKMVDIPESIDAPLRWLDDRYFPEITLLDVTRDSEMSPGGDISSMEVMQGNSPVDGLQNNMPSSELCGQTVAEPGTLDIIQSEDLSSTLDGNLTHTISSLSEQSDNCLGEKIPKASLEVTRDISMSSVLEDSRPSLERSGLNVPKIQTPTEDTLGTHPANITHDLSSSSNMSVQCTAQVSTSDMQCNTSSKNVTSELHGEPVLTCNTVEDTNENLLSSTDSELTGKLPEQSSKSAGSVNSTFTVATQSSLSASASVNTSAQTPCPQNRTIDLSPSNIKSPKAKGGAEVQATLLSKKHTEMSSVNNQNCPAVKVSSCDVHNVTFDRNSLQKSSCNTIVGEAGATTFCLQNNTFDTKSPAKQNGTITVSEMSSSVSHQNTFDKPSSPETGSATSSPKDNNYEAAPAELPKHNGTKASIDPECKMVDIPESAFEANPAVEVSSGAGGLETKDHSQSGLPMRDGLSDTLGHQSMDMDDNKANTLNLDDTLDLRADHLITSTPMTNCKMFNIHTEREEGKITMAQKKLYGDVPSKPDGEVPSDVPSNIVCNRKTFLTQSTAKSFWPPLKAASQLLKYKSGSTVLGKCEPLTSGLPMTRQRSQAEALRNTATSDAPQATTGIQSSYNLRATTTGSKLPNPGLRKPQLSGIPSAVQRAAPGLRPPSTRSNTQAASSSDKPHGPTATNPAPKISQAQKHPLTRGEALPVAKRKKMDAPLTSGTAEVSASSCDAANRAKNPKQPTTNQRALPAKTLKDDAAVPASTAETTTSCNAFSKARALKQPVTSHRAPLPKNQGQSCAKCAVLEQQLKIKSEEIRRLKEELLKYTQEEEDC